MKSIAFSFLLLSCLCCFANDTNVIAATDWSEPVELMNLETGHDHAIRGRLLIVAGSEPAQGMWSKTDKDNTAMTFVELQNVTGGYSENADVCFDAMKLNCTLTDESGKSVPKHSHPWSGRGAFSPCWEVLPYNSTIRLFVNSGSKSPLTVFPNGEPWSYWLISTGDTNIYYLSGTLDICSQTNESPRLQRLYDSHCKGTLIFPKTKISANKQ